MSDAEFRRAWGIVQERHGEEFRMLAEYDRAQ